MKKVVAIFLLIVIVLIFILSAIGCASQKRSHCPTYSNMYKYEYHDLGDDSIKIEYEYSLRYLPGDTVDRFPENTSFVVISVARQGLKLTLPKL